MTRRERPCYLQLAFSVYDKATGVPVDSTPHPHKRSIKLAAGGREGEIPCYDPRWTQAYIAAVTALAEHFRDHECVAGYWHAAGWNQETQAACQVGNANWGANAAAQLSESDYLNCVRQSTLAAHAAWAPKPVYLPGTPAPGRIWGHTRREIVADLLRAGVGYMNCGLQSDLGNAYGIGVKAGLGIQDIALGVTHLGFEEGRRFSKNPLELYWMLLHALHWQADFVNLYGGISAKDYPAIAGLLPQPATRWLVFRDAEFAVQTYTDAAGQTHGVSGEPGLWGQGLTVLDPTEFTLTFDGGRYDLARWQAHAPGGVRLRAPGLADGVYQVTLWTPEGSQNKELLDIVGEMITLPAGVYHRVDVAPRGASVEARIAALEQRVALLENQR